VHRGSPSRQRIVVVDEPGERSFDLTEGAGGLGQHAQTDLAGEVPRGSNQVGEDDCDLTVTTHVKCEPLRVLHDAPPVGANTLDATEQIRSLGSLAVV